MTITTARHPAAWNRKALTVAADRVVHILGEQPITVLDPFAGVGRVHELRDLGFVTVGGELEPEWVSASEHTIVADALQFPADDNAFDAVITSPCWGSRMADSHDAQERCSVCGGRGCEEGCGTCEYVNAGPDSHKVCRACGGAGRRDYVRNTYRHALGRPLTPGSAGAMQFGPAYRHFHRDWLVEAMRLVRPEGVIVVNVANHIRAGAEVDVVGWWLGMMYGEGLLIRAVDWVPAAKLRHGANRDLRVDGEVNVVAQVRP